MLFVILNGKKAEYPYVREAISTLRKEVDDLHVRVTYEYGDVERFLAEAVQKCAERVVIDEINNPSHDGEFIKYLQTPWLESECDELMPVNLDGEPYWSKKIRFEIVHNAIDLVLPENCPCLK